jgi:hypothetical protein
MSIVFIKTFSSTHSTKRRNDQQIQQQLEKAIHNNNDSSKTKSKQSKTVTYPSMASIDSDITQYNP